jgi:hypothetical protein
MPRRATGQVVVDERRTSPVYAIRFTAQGRRQYVTLGCARDGWTQAKAQDQPERELAAVRLGTWTPPAPEPAPVVQSDPTFHDFASVRRAGVRCAERRADEPGEHPAPCPRSGGGEGKRTPGGCRLDPAPGWADPAQAAPHVRVAARGARRGPRRRNGPARPRGRRLYAPSIATGCAAMGTRVRSSRNSWASSRRGSEKAAGCLSRARRRRFGVTGKPPKRLARAGLGQGRRRDSNP